MQDNTYDQATPIQLDHDDPLVQSLETVSRPPQPLSEDDATLLAALEATAGSGDDEPLYRALSTDDSGVTSPPLNPPVCKKRKARKKSSLTLGTKRRKAVPLYKFTVTCSLVCTQCGDVVYNPVNRTDYASGDMRCPKCVLEVADVPMETAQPILQAHEAYVVAHKHKYACTHCNSVEYGEKPAQTHRCKCSVPECISDCDPDRANKALLLCPGCTKRLIEKTLASCQLHVTQTGCTVINTNTIELSLKELSLK